MVKVGLTGGIACGKTVIAQMFAARGAHVVYADQIAHELMRPGQPVYDEVVRHFGPKILASDGTIDRAKLAAAAFAPDAAGHSRIQELNCIVHPAVIERQDQWAEEVRAADPEGVALIEAALIFEAGVQHRFDCLVVVACDPEQKAERLARRTGWELQAARAEVERRSAAQWPDEQKVAAADFVIRNTGSLAEAEQQVDAVFRELKHRAVQARKVSSK